MTSDEPTATTIPAPAGGYCPGEGKPPGITAIAGATPSTPEPTTPVIAHPLRVRGVEPLAGVRQPEPVREDQYLQAAAAGLRDAAVRDLVCLPDGRLAIASCDAGLMIYDPSSGASKPIRAGPGLPSDQILSLELDTMPKPPTLHVATTRGAAALRVLPRAVPASAVSSAGWADIPAFLVLPSRTPRPGRPGFPGGLGPW